MRRKTDFVLTATDLGSKLATAHEPHVKIIGEEEFPRLIGRWEWLETNLGAIARAAGSNEVQGENMFKRFIGHLGLLFLTFAVGTLWHEVVGHGLVGVIAGGQLTYVKVLGLELWPAVRWSGLETVYGLCNVEGIPTSTGQQIHSLAGSMSDGAGLGEPSSST